MVVHEGQTEGIEIGVNNGTAQEFTDKTAFVCLCGQCCFVEMEVCG